MTSGGELVRAVLLIVQDSLGCGDSWRELFDVVIAKANKPDFYTSERPFRLIPYAFLIICVFLCIYVCLYGWMDEFILDQLIHFFRSSLLLTNLSELVPEM